jgi:predicted O-methyltransferase YrrM
MRRLRNLTRRQAILLAGAAVLCAAVAGAALTGYVGVALAVLGMFFAVLVGGLLLLARRLATLQRANRKAQAEMRAVLDQTQRRVLGAIEELLLHSGDRHRELADALAAQRRETELLVRSQTGEVEALVQLFRGFTPRAPMPSSAGSTMDLLHLTDLIRVRRPRLVVELGGGVSSVWMAYVLEETGGRLISLDHDEARASRSRVALARHGLSEVAEVRDAPLRFSWYDLEALADVSDIDLLLIDGSPATGPNAAGMRALKDQLADAATVIVGDERGWVETIEGLTDEGEALGDRAVLSYRRVVRQLQRSQ